MSCPTVTTIQPTECIGNSLNTINNNYQSLRTGVCDNQDQINALRTLLFDLSAQPRGIVLQQAYNENSTLTKVVYTETNNQINTDVNVAPTSTQGTLLLTTQSTPITPKSLNNHFLIQYTIDRGYSNPVSQSVSILSRYQNGSLEPNAIYTSGDNSFVYVTMIHTGQIRVPVTSLTPTHFNVRVGIPLGLGFWDSWYHGSNYNVVGQPILGGTRRSSLIVQEIKG